MQSTLVDIRLRVLAESTLKTKDPGKVGPYLEEVVCNVLNNSLDNSFIRTVRFCKALQV